MGVRIGKGLSLQRGTVNKWDGQNGNCTPTDDTYMLPLPEHTCACMSACVHELTGRREP